MRLVKCSSHAFSSLIKGVCNEISSSFRRRRTEASILQHRLTCETVVTPYKFILPGNNHPRIVSKESGEHFSPMRLPHLIIKEMHLLRVSCQLAPVYGD